MRTTNETCSDSNYSSFNKESFQKNTSGYSPFLKFNENLYNKCQSKFSEFASNKKNDLKLMINSQTKEKISIKDFLENESNTFNKLTPIPFINKRRIKNEGEKKEFKNLERNVVLMRRLEYANKIKEKNLKKKYYNKINQIIFIQKMTRGFLVRKVIYQVGVINNSLKKFFFLIKLCVQKKYFYLFKYNIEQILTRNDYGVMTESERIKINNNMFKDDDYDENNEKTLDIGKNNNFLINDNFNNENNFYNKNKFYDENYFLNNNAKKRNYINDNYNDNEINKKPMQLINEQLNKIKNQDINEYNNIIIENENYIDFSGKVSETNDKNKYHNNMYENYIKASSSNKNFFRISKFASNMSINSYKAKIIFIQRYFRKFLFQKEFYGKFGAKKIGFILLKNVITNKIGYFVFNIIKLIYKNCNNDVTQEEDFIQLDSERIEEVKQKYNNAIESINFQ